MATLNSLDSFLSSINIQRLETYTCENEVFSIPTELRNLIAVLKKAETILELKDNWDEEGNEHISPATFSATVHFLITYAKNIFYHSGDCIDIPSIYPSSNGSIDIDWETETYGLIINIAKDGAEASYYGDNKSSQMTEGVFNPHEFNINLLPKAITL
ncbi:hypothetical protein EZS27_005192 [termite gut metagenome]|uniref:Uncharacterized protein n=1 Tax=termite gut metagenome TaxID=433724 RepID=A0A5J4SPM7_9ZZZZ